MIDATSLRLLVGTYAGVRYIELTGREWADALLAVDPCPILLARLINDKYHGRYNGKVGEVPVHVLIEDCDMTELERVCVREGRQPMRWERANERAA